MIHLIPATVDDCLSTVDAAATAGLDRASSIRVHLLPATVDDRLSTVDTTAGAAAATAAA